MYDTKGEHECKLGTWANNNIDTVAASGEGDGGGMGWKPWINMQTFTHGMDKQPGPIVWHRELYSICCDKS